MSYKALYRKWRPLIFDDVVEQEHIVRTLKNIVTSGRVSHAYLFCGPRGTGKTSIAKILSRAINCLLPENGNPCNKCEICLGILNESILDVLEIDAASNNSVDNVREIREELIYAASQSRFKVYIIDEVHMLSSGAFNALLKTLEEPPPMVVFILATTEPHKLPATILSRCQRYDFHRITIAGMAERVRKIATENGIVVRENATRLIARLADGAMRDAISLLDQCISLGTGEITIEDVQKTGAMTNEDITSAFLDMIAEGNETEIFSSTDSLLIKGVDLVRFVDDMVTYCRNILICKMTRSPEEFIETSSAVIEGMKVRSEAFNHEEITFFIRELSVLEYSLKSAPNQRIAFEVAMIRLCQGLPSKGSDDILEKLALLERRLSELTEKYDKKLERAVASEIASVIQSTASG
ncbi:MAG: DNA polymerase III subunit gamma/tau, partial [Clostridiales bacterium]|nr:DNA polymerase III subunit gamma/tau [Clostridiales bacterium]